MTRFEFSRELQSHKDLLFSFALKMSRNYQDAQDLFQDASIRGFKYRNRFEPGTNFRAWMATIIRHTLIDSYRKKQQRPFLNEPIEKFAFAVENKNAIANSGEQNLRLRELLSHLNALKNRYRTPFLMYYQGYEYKEIAEYLDIPMGTVKSRLNTARSMLKQRLMKVA
ncbi:MAG: RNA polymerase sigma factor [Lewinellaceae bacterium]|nr:RNA polymerase sigma factor [Phaeodactylibacter sp.]MCB9039175.1 RNA polymerase sigma factor [Lewinellaceae bacterium]